jgi:peptide/nickel transport system substrate-binding protein
MEVGILGPLVVRRDGHEVAVSAPKQRLLLVLLLLRRGELVPTETLIDKLWAGDPPTTAVKVVQVYISQLRKALGNGALETGPGGYRLHVEPAAVDAALFEQLLGQGVGLLASGDASSAERVLRAALALWRGPLLAEFRFEDIAAQEIGRLEELRLLALAKRLEAELALGRAAESVAELQALVREHPLQENLRHLLMLALYRAGRQADALAAYQDARTTLVADLGIEPGESLQRLEAAILAHEPSLDLVAAPPVATKTALRLPSPTEGTARRRPRRIVRSRRWLVGVGAVVLVAGTVVAVLSRGGPSPVASVLSAGSVGFIDAHGTRAGSQVAVQGLPTSVAAGAGAVWVVDAAAATVARIDSGSHAVVQTIPVGSNPSGVAANDSGVWVANHDDATVSWISPQTNAVVRTVPVGAGPVAVANGFGSVWVTNSEDRTLTRIDAATGDVSATIRTNAVGRGVAVGGGSVWVTDEATSGVVQVNPATDTVTATATVGTGPTGIAFGAGSVWVVNALDGTVSSLDPTTRTVRATIPVPGGPSAVSVAADLVWVSAEFASRVVRIDPHRDVVVGSAPIGNRPVQLAGSGAGVWVAVQASGVGHRGGRLIVLGGGLDSIDPGVAAFVPTLGPLAYDALTTLRHAGGSAGTQIVPDLAAAVPQPTANGTSYTFHLRSGIRYSDGTPLRAADFRLGLERMLEFGGPFASTFTHIVGAAECLAHRRCDLTAGVIAEDASTVTLRLSTPDARLVEELTVLTPVPGGTPMHDAGTKPVPGTGPYQIQTYVPGKLLTFERNDNFHVWSAAARPDGYPDEIAYRIVTDQDTATRTLLADQADLVTASHETALLGQFIARRPLRVHVDAEQATIFMFLNVGRPPFNDLRVRRAVNYAVDRAHIAALAGTPFARPTCQLVPPTVSGYRPYCPYTIDPDATGQWKAPDLTRAKSLIEASGTSGQPVVVWAFADYVTEARYVIALLNRLGYKASLHYVPNAATYFADLARAPAVQAGMFGWFGDVLAVDALSVNGCDFDPSPTHFCDHAVDAQLTRLANEESANPAGSAHLAEALDREITDNAPWVPLFTPTYVDLTATRVGNYQAQGGQALLDQLWVR